MKRRLIRIAMLGGISAAVVAALVAFLVLRHPGTLQDWIGSQLQDIANGYLGPKLSFTDLAYHYPLDVSLKHLRLTAEDPVHPGHTIDVIACDSAEVSLGEIPSIGKPIVISKIILDDPLISVVATAPGSKRFVGISDLVRGGSSSSSPQPQSSNKPAPKLSDVFQMRLVQITNGKILYNPRIAGTVPMQLDKINTTLNIQPSEAGSYNLSTVIEREPVFKLQLNKGEFNLDSLTVKDVDIDLLADLNAKKVDYLPPEIQAVLKQYEARGKLELHVIASMPLQDPLSGQAKVAVSLEGANLAMHSLRIPIDGLQLAADYADKKVNLTRLHIKALDGTADVSGSLALNERLDAALQLSIAGMIPQELLADQALRSPYPAQLDLNLSVATALLSLFGKAPPPVGAPLASISLKDFALSAEDPTTPGARVDVLACKSLQVAMSEPIVQGKPVVVDTIALNRPVISAVSTAPGEMSFVGIPNFPASAPPEDRTSSAPSNPPAATKVSDLFRLKSLSVSGAKFLYDARITDTRPMRLDPLNLSVHLDPGSPGTYHLEGQVARDPAFNLGIRGVIDVDNPALQNVNLALHADLTGDDLDFLPPQLQLVFHRLGVTAQLNFNGKGSIALANISNASVQFQTDIQKIDVHRNGLHIPIDDLSLSAKLEHGVSSATMRIKGLNNVFDLSSTIVLNKNRDADIVLTLKDIKLEPLLAALRPGSPAQRTSTTLNGEIELKSPAMIAMGAFAPKPGELVASLSVRNLRLTTDDPVNPGQPLDFFAWEEFNAQVLRLPFGGGPLIVDSVKLSRPVLRAVATTQGSSDFAGFVALREMAAPKPAASTMPSESVASTEPSKPRPKIADVVQLKRLAVTDASLYYDPRVPSETDPAHPTVPLSVTNMALSANLDSLSGDVYRFGAHIPSKPDFDLNLDGKIDLSSLMVSPLNVNLAAVFGSHAPKYLPPQVQELLPRYAPVGSLWLKTCGSLPLTNLSAADFLAALKLDEFAITAGTWRFPMNHLRLPVRLRRQEIDIFDPRVLGGPTLEALGGDLTLTGSLMLDKALNTTIALDIDGMTLQDLMACRTSGEKSTLIGTVKSNIRLIDAPLLTIAAAAAPPTTQPSQPPPPASPPQASAEHPIYASDLPSNWGNAVVDITHAHLAGLEVLQGISNIAKSVFADLFAHQEKNETHNVVPKEKAHVVCTFDGDKIDFSQIHYEGEVIAADGHGFITLDQHLDLILTGGLMQKLGGLGAVGNWIKQASDSLLYYHVYGTFHDIKYEVKRGNGEPIVQGVTKGAEEGGKYIGIGINKAGEGINQGFNQAGKFFGGIFGGNKKKDQPQTQPSGQ